jgi:catechol 2,3-dioxygenase
MEGYSLPHGVRIGHVHVRVTDLQRAIDFYRGVLGFNLVVDGRPVGLQTAFLGAGHYHHHIALNWTPGDAAAASPDHAGLQHVAIVYPGRPALADAVQRLFDVGYPIDDARDHGATLSVYLKDPDGNGIELYYDMPFARWFDALGRPVVKSEPMNVLELLEEPAASS